MLKTFVLEQTSDDISHALDCYEELRNLIDIAKEPISSVVTSKVPTLSQHVLDTKYVYSFDHFDSFTTSIDRETFAENPSTIQHKETIEALDFVLTSDASELSIQYPIEDSLTQASRHILPWVPLLAPYIGAKPQVLQKMLTNWMEQTYAAEPLNFSDQSTSWWTRKKHANYICSFSQQQVGRHQLVKNWIIRGPDLLELWYQMLQKRYGQNHFVMFSPQKIRSVEQKKIVSTLPPLPWTILKEASSHWIQMDLHCDSVINNTHMDLICRASRDKIYEFRVIIDGTGADLEHIERKLTAFERDQESLDHSSS